MSTIDTMVEQDPATRVAYIVGERNELRQEVARLTAELEGARVSAAPKPRKPRKPKVAPGVAGLLKAKFPAGVTIGAAGPRGYGGERRNASGELAAWERAMDAQHGPLHGPATRAEAHLSSAVVKRRPARVAGPLLMHNGTAIHDEKTARQYVKALA